MRVLNVIIGCIVLIVWAVVGLLLWIPLLSRMIAVYTFSVVASVYGAHDSTPALRGLDAATGFYLRGFKTIFVQIWNPVDSMHSAAAHLPTNWDTIFGELFWAFVFWYSFVLLLAPIFDISRGPLLIAALVIVVLIIVVFFLLEWEKTLPKSGEKALPPSEDK